MSTSARPDAAGVRLADAIRRHREAVLDRLLELEWAADTGDPNALVRERGLVRPRAELFLDSLLAGLGEDDWEAFDRFIASRTTQLLVAGVVSPEDLDRRALTIATYLIPFVLEDPDPAPVLAALYGTMQTLSSGIVGAYSRSVLEDSRRLDDLKTMFLRMTGHELRAPLGTIRGYSSMLLDGDFGELGSPVRRAATAIDTAAGSGLAMLDRLAEVARLESGKEALRREVHPVEEVVLAAVEPLREAARARAVTLEVDASGDARLDAEEVVIAIRNLLGNALKYGDGGGLVRVRGWSDERGATFEVSDHGRGIDPADLPHLFERYYRSEGTRREQVTGSGLGLYIVRRIAELHGGAASVESSPGAGATFRVWLPAG